MMEKQNAALFDGMPREGGSDEVTFAETQRG
jgi:hypothetical protein